METKNNNFKKWESSIINFPKTLHVVGLYDDFEGFRIVVRAEGTSNMFKFNFENYIAYRNADEGSRLKSIELFPTNTREWCLFQSNDSDYINWIVQESLGIYSKEQITHFVIMTPNDIIEILSLDEPEIIEL